MVSPDPVGHSLAFTAYKSPADSVADHGHLLPDNSRYRRAFQAVSEPYKFAHCIAQAGYSTDSNYAAKLREYHGDPMPLAKVGSLKLQYQAWGPNEASAGIVLVHGLGSSSHIWDFTAPLLAEQGLRVVALDQRGHGESDQPDSGYGFASVVADLAGFVEAVGLTELSVIVGHSWGASVVLHYAAAYPDRTAAIGLVDGGTSSPGERWSWEETEARLRPPELDGMQWTDLLQRMVQNNDVFPISRAEAISKSVFQIDVDGRVTRRFRIPNHMQVVRAMWEQRPAELFARLHCPVLLMPARRSSDATEMTSAKGAAVSRAQTIQPNVRVRWFDDTVHDVPLQRPEDLASELLSLAHQTLASRTAP